MDQTAPADQGFLRYHRKCRKNPNLDRDFGIPAGAILKKELSLSQSLYTILQVLSISLFAKTPILSAFSTRDHKDNQGRLDNQLSLFSI
jgi:hypothetical protein